MTFIMKSEIIVLTLCIICVSLILAQDENNDVFLKYKISSRNEIESQNGGQLRGENRLIFFFI